MQVVGFIIPVGMPDLHIPPITLFHGGSEHDTVPGGLDRSSCRCGIIDTQMGHPFFQHRMEAAIGKVAAEYNIQLSKGTKCLFIYIENHSSEDGVPIAWAHYRLAQIFKHQKHKENALKHIDLAISELPNIDVFKTEKSYILKLI